MELQLELQLELQQTLSWSLRLLQLELMLLEVPL